MPLESRDKRHDGLLESRFSPSVPMPTYLVAFIVCDFEYKETKTKSNKKVVKLWSLFWTGVTIFIIANFAHHRRTPRREQFYQKEHSYKIWDCHLLAIRYMLRIVQRVLVRECFLWEKTYNFSLFTHGRYRKHFQAKSEPLRLPAFVKLK